MAKNIQEYRSAVDAFYGRYDYWLKCVQGGWHSNEPDCIHYARRFILDGDIDFLYEDGTDTLIYARRPFNRVELTNPTVDEVLATLKPVSNTSWLFKRYLVARLISPWTRNAHTIHRRYEWACDRDNWRCWFIEHFLIHIPFLYFKHADQIRSMLRFMYGKYYMLEVLRSDGFYGTVKYGKTAYQFNSNGYELEFINKVWGSFSIIVNTPTKRAEIITKNLTYWQLFKIIRRMQKDSK